MQKPTKLSRYTGIDEHLPNYITDLDKDMISVSEYLQRFPKIYQQSGEPAVPTNEIAVWRDTDDEKFYFLVNIGGTVKKVELS